MSSNIILGNVWSFALKNGSKLKWFWLHASDQSSALTEARKIANKNFGIEKYCPYRNEKVIDNDVDIYAGPIPEKCHNDKCKNQANLTINGWKHLCKAHSNHYGV